MNKKTPSSGRILKIGIPLSIAAGVILVFADSLSAGLLTAGAGLVVSAILECVQNSRQSKKEHSTPLFIDTAALKKLEKEVRHTQPKAMKKEMRTLFSQCERMRKKGELLEDSLDAQFSSARATQNRFASTINETISLFEEQVNAVLRRVSRFDVDGYEQLKREHREYTDAMKPYEQQIEEIRQLIDANETILGLFDRLLVELDRLSDNSADLASLPQIGQLQELIATTPLYDEKRQAKKEAQENLEEISRSDNGEAERLSSDDFHTPLADSGSK